MNLPARASLLALFAALAAGLFAAGFLYVRVHHTQVLEDAHREISLVTSMRVGQIADWILALRSDAILRTEHPLNARMLTSFFQSGQPPDDDVRVWLSMLKRHRNYHNVLLVNTGGVIQASAMDEGGGQSLSADCQEIFHQALRLREPTWHDLHWKPGMDHPHLELVIPISDPQASADAAPLGAIIFQSNPEEILFPSFRAWPFFRRTAETYIVMPQGTNLVYLSGLRHGPRQSLRLPLAQTNLAAVRIALGAEGVLRGQDYRGATVLAKGRTIPGMHWVVVSEIDEDEVFGNVRRMGWLIAAFVGALVLAAGFGVILLWTRRERAAWRRDYEREQNLAVTLNSIGDGVIVTDTRGRVTRLNPVAERLTGWSLADAQGRHLDEVFRIVNYYSREPVPSPADRVLAEGRIMGLANHTMLIARDGSERAIADSGAPIRDADSRILGVVLVFRDVTEDYARDRELRVRSQALDTSITPIAFTDLEGRITYVNAAFLAAWGLQKPDEVLGRDCAAFWRDPAAVGSVLRRVREFGSWTGELDARTAGDATRTLQVAANLIRDAEGHPIGCMASFLDVTETRRMTETLREAKAAADAANRAKRLFLANMSHELRTPLNPIIGFADLLGDAPNLTEEQRQFTHMIRQRSTDLLQLINDILDLSKIDADAVPITPEAVPLRPFLADLVRVTEPLARDKGLAFSWHVDPAAPDVIMADPLRLRQVLLNLLSNAVKFTPNGAVTLQVENSPAPLATPGSTGLRFSVRDTGIGLASENLQDLFKPFVQADMSFTRRFGGAGLGLAIARRLVQKMGGDIGVESKEGQGSVFHFTLRFPAREAPPASALPASAAPIQNSGRNRRVLLIEDDVSNRFLVEIILRKAGYECEAAEDGEEGLRRFEEKPPDLVLLDIQLPRMNGLEVTARIRELDQAAGRHTPIVAITAYAMRGDRERFLAAGMDAYVAKPIQTAALLAAMNAVLSGTSAAPAQSEKTS